MIICRSNDWGKHKYGLDEGFYESVYSGTKPWWSIKGSSLQYHVQIVLEEYQLVNDIHLISLQL